MLPFGTCRERSSTAVKVPKVLVTCSISTAGMIEVNPRGQCGKVPECIFAERASKGNALGRSHGVLRCPRPGGIAMLHFATTLQCPMCGHVFAVCVHPRLPPDAKKTYRVCCPSNASWLSVTGSMLQQVAE